jgi:hypothetical protein
MSRKLPSPRRKANNNNKNFSLEEEDKIVCETRHIQHKKSLMPGVSKKQRSGGGIRKRREKDKMIIGENH